MKATLGLLETVGLTPAIAAIDAMEKAAKIRVVQMELNDIYGVCAKISGTVEAVHAAIDVGCKVAEQMGGQPVARVIAKLGQSVDRAVFSPAEYNTLIDQEVVFIPANSSEERKNDDVTQTKEDPYMSSDYPFALGLIETQGFTAVFEAIDTACKAANVEVIGKEKLGGGYVTVIIKGNLSAVTAAVTAGQQNVEGLGKLIAAHVIARPSPSVMQLLPKTSC